MPLVGACRNQEKKPQLNLLHVGQIVTALDTCKVLTKHIAIIVKVTTTPGTGFQQNHSLPLVPLH